MPSINWATIGLIALGFEATSGSTPDKAIIKPSTVPIKPNTVKELAIYLIWIMRENNFNFSAWAIFDLLEAFLPLVFDKKSAALEGESGL